MVMVLEESEKIERIERKLNSIKSTVDSIYSRPSVVQRPGLYIIAFLGMMGATKACAILQDQTAYQTENVIGGEAPEKFLESRGKRIFLEIDGMPVEQYVRNR